MGLCQLAEYRQNRLACEKLLFDRNNYRFHDDKTYTAAPLDRFHEPAVQNDVYLKLRSDSTLKALSDSIIKNTFIPAEPLAVWAYPHQEDRYVVIEGNRRLAAARLVIDMATKGGVDLDDKVLDSVRHLPVVIVEAEPQELEVIRASLMGIRHVAGIKAWGGYQSAELVAHMRDELGLEPKEIAARLGMKSSQVVRRYRAFKVFKQMQNDEEYGEYAEPSMYDLFAEAVDQAQVRQWLGWDKQENRFANEEELHQFYALISPSGDKDEIEPKIRTYQQVRGLKDILVNEDSKRELLENERSTWEDAYSMQKRDSTSKNWASKVKSAIDALDNFSVSILKSLTPSDRQLLTRLNELAGERLKDYDRFRGS